MGKAPTKNSWTKRPRLVTRHWLFMADTFKAAFVKDYTDGLDQAAATVLLMAYFWGLFAIGLGLFMIIAG